MGSGTRRMEFEGRRMERGGWRMEERGQRVEDEGRRMKCGGCGRARQGFRAGFASGSLQFSKANLRWQGCSLLEAEP